MSLVAQIGAKICAFSRATTFLLCRIKYLKLSFLYSPIIPLLYPPYIPQWGLYFGVTLVLELAQGSDWRQNLRIFESNNFPFIQNQTLKTQFLIFPHYTPIIPPLYTQMSHNKCVTLWLLKGVEWGPY